MYNDVRFVFKVGFGNSITNWEGVGNSITNWGGVGITLQTGEMLGRYILLHLFSLRSKMGKGCSIF